MDVSFAGMVALAAGPCKGWRFALHLDRMLTQEPLIRLGAFLGVLTAMAVLEHAFPRRPQRLGWRRWPSNLGLVAVASVLLPFLPLTPVQVLLNNLLYDIGEIGIPFDDVDEAETKRPHSWDMREVLRFSLVMGPLSSVFDLATFASLLLIFAVPEESFRTAWFVESMATQVLVVFLIRTARPAWLSRPNRILVVSSLSALAVALAAALGPLAGVLGFGRLPWPLLAGKAGGVGGRAISTSRAA
ncbi:cation transporting ATPase C-terminal domain-containing protein, partial [Nostoc sp. NIES-2111]